LQKIGTVSVNSISTIPGDKDMSKINGDKARRNISDRKQTKMREKIRAIRSASDRELSIRGSEHK
jgi:hypothetical protein